MGALIGEQSIVSVLAQILGVLGFFIAAAALGWQIWSYREDRRERLHLSVKGFRELGRPFTSIHVTVRNSGRIPVYLSAVWLEHDVDEPAERFRDGGRLRPTTEGVSLEAQGEVERPLHPGNHATFALSDSSAPFCKTIAELPPEKVCVAVHTSSGRCYRLSGREVHGIVRSIALSVEQAGQRS